MLKKSNQIKAEASNSFISNKQVLFYHGNQISSLALYGKIIALEVSYQNQLL